MIRHYCNTTHIIVVCGHPYGYSKSVQVLGHTWQVGRYLGCATHFSGWSVISMTAQPS